MTYRPRRSDQRRAAWLAGALTVFLLAGPVDASTAVSNQETRNEATVRQAFDHWENQTGNVFDILSPDVRWTIHGTGPVAGTYESREDFLQRGSLPLVNKLATPVVPEVHDIWTEDDRVIIRFDGAATTTSGAPYQNQFVWIFRLEDDLVVEAEAFLDLAAYQTVVDNNDPRPETGGE